MRAPRRVETDPADLEVHLVPMRRRHLRQILKIEAQVYPRPWTVTLFASELNLRDSRHYTVARVNGSVVGYAGLMFNADEAHVTNVAVDPAWHRHKIGTRLFVHLVSQARVRGCRLLTLEVRVSNGAAQSLYRKFGLVSVGVRKNYYAETNEDAIIMSVEGICSPAYTERLETIEAAIPGTTVVATGRW